MLKVYFSFFYKKYIKIPLLILRMSIIGAVRKDGIEHSGYLAFLSVLALFPFLIFLVSIAANFGATKFGLEVVNEILSHIPKNLSSSIEPRIKEIFTGPPQGLLTVAVIGIIWTASSMVEGLRTILNKAYRVSLPPPYIWRRMLSILQFFIIIITILLTSLLLIIIPALLRKFEAITGFSLAMNYDLFYMRSITTFFVLLVLISALYYFIPNVNQKWDSTLPGSVICIFSWSIILKLFAIYLVNFKQFNLIYGGLAGIIGTLVFFYMISFGFIIGAEFNYHFQRAYRGSKK